MNLKQLRSTRYKNFYQRILSPGIKTVVLISLYTLLVFGFGYFVHRSGFSFGETYRYLQDRINLLPKSIDANLSKPKIDTLYIDIAHEDYLRLAYQREIALSDRILLNEDDQSVPATIQHNGEMLDVVIRLKGDFKDHYDTEKWSLRVEVKGDHTILGMKQFSIQHPKTRNFVYEWIYQQMLRREGIISIRYEFVNVTINGKGMGIYALEEHFEKRLVENNQLREGPIVRFGDELLWADRNYLGPEIFGRIDPIYDNSYYKSEIDGYQTNQAYADPQKFAQYIQAIHLLESFRRGDLAPGDVFDVEKLARFYAVTDLTGAIHNTYWTNLKFYYNPVTSLLEPIGFDGDSGLIDHLSVQQGRAFDTRLSRDRVFMTAYIKQLDRVSAPGFLEGFLAEISGDLQENLYTLYSEFPEFEFSQQQYFANRELIRFNLNPLRALIAYMEPPQANQLHLKLSNIHSMPIEIVKVDYQGKTIFEPESTILIPLFLPHKEKPLDFLSLTISLPPDFQLQGFNGDQIAVYYRLPGAEAVFRETVSPWPYIGENTGFVDLMRTEPNLTGFEFIVLNEDEKYILFKPGYWEINETLIIPGGYKVKMNPGTILDLLNSSRVVSFSPLELIGTESDPIIFDSTDASGQGLVVVQAEDESTIDYVIFNNLSAIDDVELNITGAVTFYESPVRISNSRFIQSRSEDALNIVRATFSLDRVVIADTVFDAFDMDFSEGTIRNSEFLRIGNDALDFSGSVVDLFNVYIDETGDKGLSAGESSTIKAENVEIRNTSIAVASKDSSTVSIRNLSMHGNSVDLALYKKKPEFGSGEIYIYGLSSDNDVNAFLVEIGSVLMIDDQKIEAREKDLYDKLYGEAP